MTESHEARGDAPIESSVPVGAVPLESILCTEELHRRPSRPPGHEEENQALVKLASALADSPTTILQVLAETILHITQCDSAGLSLLTSDGQTPDARGERFYWPAIAGAWNPHAGGGTPRNFGPCGDVLDQNRTLLFKHFERRYPYLLPVVPAAEECLLVPFYVAGKAVGTIWAIMHGDRRRFDAEDERVMGSLGKFASSAYQALASIDELRFQIGERERAEAALHKLADGLETQVRVRTQELERRTEELLATNKELEKEITERQRAEQALIGTQSRLKYLADEQAALRRVATLVARASPPEEVFAAVTAEAGRLLDADITGMSRYDPDGAHTLVGTWASADAAVPVPGGTRFGPGGRNTHSLVFQTGQPARIDDYGQATGPAAERARELGARAAVGVPVRVEGRLWGVVTITSKRGPLLADTEARLARFTELAATAIANAEARAALTASRARIVAAADATRRRFERDLHDGGQQRLVSLALQLRATQAAAPAEASGLVQRLDGVIAEVYGVLEELREIARGLHPSVLAEGGLRPALKALARRAAIPVRLDVRVEARLPEPAELTAYYAVSEALTNIVKHARASAVEVEVAADQGVLRVCVRDDGCGGADASRGSGLTGLRDRVEAIGGRISLRSPPGAGTAVEIALPLQGIAPLAGELVR